jgi:hypothetical protein
MSWARPGHTAIHSKKSRQPGRVLIDSTSSAETVTRLAWNQRSMTKSRHKPGCEDGSGWACNELAILLVEHYGNRQRAATESERACRLAFSAGCDNTVAITQGDMFRRDAPTVADYRLVLRGSKGPFPDVEPAQLYARACDQGWPGACQIQ